MKNWFFFISAGKCYFVCPWKCVLMHFLGNSFDSCLSCFLLEFCCYFALIMRIISISWRLSVKLFELYKFFLKFSKFSLLRSSSQVFLNVKPSNFFFMLARSLPIVSNFTAPFVIIPLCIKPLNQNFTKSNLKKKTQNSNENRISTKWLNNIKISIKTPTHPSKNHKTNWMNFIFCLKLIPNEYEINFYYVCIPPFRKQRHKTKTEKMIIKKII